MRVLITAGPTREHLDPVRFLSNGSSGKMGFALARAARAAGHEVILVAGPVVLPTPAGVERIDVVSAQQMFEAAASRFPECGALIAVAAVADYRPAEASALKIKEGKGERTLKLVPTVDILKTLAASRRPDQLAIGFAAETHDVEGYARRKLEEKHLDWIVANDVSRPEIGMNADLNSVWVLGRAGARFSFGPAPKDEVARVLVERLVSTSA